MIGLNGILLIHFDFDLVWFILRVTLLMSINMYMFRALWRILTKLDIQHFYCKRRYNMWVPSSSINLRIISLRGLNTFEVVSLYSPERCLTLKLQEPIKYTLCIKPVEFDQSTSTITTPIKVCRRKVTRPSVLPLPPTCLPLGSERLV